MHIQTDPSILYFGTPVVIVSTKNTNGTDNLAPISSVFWLGWRCIIGIAASSKTTENLLLSRQCVLNLPSINQVSSVNLLAKTTGTNPVPEGKLAKGYRYAEDKFEIAKFNRMPSLTVEPFRVKECPVHMEAVVEAIHGVADNDDNQRGKIITFELRILKVHLDEGIIMEGKASRVDPDKWRPLIMSFQEFYGLGNRLQHSTLGEIPEYLYNTYDRERAKSENKHKVCMPV